MGWWGGGVKARGRNEGEGLGACQEYRGLGKGEYKPGEERKGEARGMSGVQKTREGRVQNQGKRGRETPESC